MKIKFINEIEISQALEQEINQLLQKSFEGIDYNGRSYFKQLPHYRLLAVEDEKIVGHLGLDIRVMNLNGHALKVLGIVDLCVDPKHRKKGIGDRLLSETVNIGQKYRNRVDAIFLVTDEPDYYQKRRFLVMDVEVKWLKIDEHQNLGIGVERFDDAHCMIHYLIPSKSYKGQLDMLGYMY